MRFCFLHIIFLALAVSVISGSCRKSYEVSDLQVTMEMIAKRWYLDSVNTFILQNGTKSSSTENFEDGSYYQFDLDSTLLIYDAKSGSRKMRFIHVSNYNLSVYDGTITEEFEITKLTPGAMVLHRSELSNQSEVNIYYFFKL